MKRISNDYRDFNVGPGLVSGITLIRSGEFVLVNSAMNLGEHMKPAAFAQAGSAFCDHGREEHRADGEPQQREPER